MAKYDGADAATRVPERADQGQGLARQQRSVTVTGDNYFLKDVPLDDEAFCTKELLTASSGVLARKGNTLVYVSLIDSNTAAQQNADDVNCDNAQKLASKVLG